MAEKLRTGHQPIQVNPLKCNGFNSNLFWPVPAFLSVSTISAGKFNLLILKGLILQKERQLAKHLLNEVLIFK